MANGSKIGLWALLGLISFIFSFGDAAYEPTIILKYPFSYGWPEKVA